MLIQKGKKENFIPVQKTSKNTYIIYLSPVNITEEDFDVQYFAVKTNTKNLSTYDIKQALIELQKEYDKSSEVNSFKVGEDTAWLDKETRLGLLNSLNVQKSAGLEKTILWLNDKSYELNIDLLLTFLTNLEVYAINCFNNTANHLKEIAKLNDRDQILNYQITTGYPDKIELVLE